ncbi:10341_t:CDS:2, partial [Gigaspora rosea]
LFPVGEVAFARLTKISSATTTAGSVCISELKEPGLPKYCLVPYGNQKFEILRDKIS